MVALLELDDMDLEEDEGADVESVADMAPVEEEGEVTGVAPVPDHTSHTCPQTV